jgi:hypothetical protein
VWVERDQHLVCKRCKVHHSSAIRIKPTSRAL